MYAIRHSLLFIFLTVVFVFFYSSVYSATPLCKDCNIIILAIDTVGAAHLPCYGYARNTAPNLCAFAEDNILFTHAYSTSSWTLPSDVSMFTSLYPSFHGITDYTNYALRLSPHIPTLFELLQQRGYATYLAIPPNDRAFPVMDVYYKGITRVIPISQWPVEELDGALHEFLESVLSGKKTFLFLHSYQAHGPYFPQEKKLQFTKDTIDNIPMTFYAMYNSFSEDFYEYLVDELAKIVGKPNATIDRDFYDKLKNAPTLAEAQKLAKSRFAELESYYTEYYYFAKIDLTDPEQIEYIKALYDQKIYELDIWFRDVFLPLIRHPALKDNTIVIITSEHGEEFLEHGRITHVTLYDSNIRVPLIISVPGMDKRVIVSPVSGVDLTPTILDLIHAPQRRYLFQGMSLVGSMTGKKLPYRLLFANGYHADESDTQTVRDGKWKMFMKWQNDTWVPYELYHTQSDLSETQNVFTSNIDIVKRLLQKNSRYESVWRNRLGKR